MLPECLGRSKPREVDGPLALLGLIGTPLPLLVLELGPVLVPCWCDWLASVRVLQSVPETQSGSLFFEGGSTRTPPCLHRLPPAPSGAGLPSVRWSAGTCGGQLSPGETRDHQGEDPLFLQCLTQAPHRMPLSQYEELSGS